MRDALKRLLNLLDEIGNEHEELFDSDVRQNIRNAIMEGFVRHRLKYEIPQDFGMFSEDGNTAVRNAISEYVATGNKKADELEIRTFHDRLNVMQDDSVCSVNGNDYEEFLGHSRGEFFDEVGNVIRTQ
ncbi:hypothetical protein [Bremerella cremea]|nr:hypothetical protein [Bremerella cremea]